MSASSRNEKKSKLFGYFKGWFHRKASEQSGAEGGANSEVAVETLAAASPVAPSVEIAPPPQAKVAAAPVARPVGSTVDRDRQDGGLAPSVTTPLQPILDGLPSELRNRVVMPQCGDLTVEIPIDKILSQLATGQIRVPFGDIRKSAPHVFSPSVEYDRISVSLPLGEILPRLNPALLVRRAPARQVEVPEDVASPFEGRGAAVTFTMGNTKPAPAAAPKATPASPAQARGPVSSGRRPSINPSVSEIPAPFPFTPPAKTPAARVADHPFSAPTRPSSAATPAPGIPMRSAPANATPRPAPAPARPASAPAMPRPTPAPAPAPSIPMSRAAATPTPAIRPSSPIPMPRPAAPIAAPAAKPATPPPSPRPVAVAPAPAARPAAPTTAGGVLQAPLASLAEGWPDAVRNELQNVDLGSARVALPAEQVEAGLKRGKVTIAWRNVRAWITPAVSGAPSAQDDVELDLPLKVLAPLFMAQKAQAKSAVARTMVDDSIPDPFSGPARAAAPVPPPAPAPTPAPTPVFAPAPVAAPKPVSRASLTPTPPPPPAGAAIPFNTAPLPAAAQAAVAPAPTSPVSPNLDSAGATIADSNYYLWENASETKLLHIETLKQQGAKGTEFTKRYSSPNEIVVRAAELKGVAGSLVALPDGLMVASQIPEDQNGDTLAAFLPQIFAKVSSCTKELRMGELNNVAFTIGNVPWKIFRVNAIFFAVFGIAGQPMPSAEIASLAGELDRKVNK